MQSSKCYTLFLGLLLTVSAWGQDNQELRLKLLFVGDIMGHDSQIEAAEVVKDSLYDYEPCFEFVEPYLEDADMAVGNLEVTLPGKPPYKGYPQFRSPEDLALSVRFAGFDMLVTANNHSNDAGPNGVINTVQLLDKYDFYHTGTFQNQAERDAYYPLIVYRGSFKLVFLNYTYGTNGLKTRPPAVVNLIEEEQIEKDMADAREMGADAIIVVMHWGNEYQRNENKEQSELADKLFAWGADLVIGAHPHVVQPVKEKTVKRADGSEKKVVAAYSLGNFISGQRREHTDGGMMFSVELAKDMQTNQTRLADHSYTLVWRYIEKNKDGSRTYRAIPIREFEGENPPLVLPDADRKAMLQYAKSTRALLEQFDSREREVVVPAN
ncbi:CapA family protein [Flavilitoribacter nigricans]|uniref:Capsule biosynthesis protein CapA n=1 Tax=Flavilitoribacter nigricans (strain ATCC 23147 / DSM 23189 / NBRC 102662 / NCIMB 1420 / SS-2) TaxID=1122177 RepID=A0A2D0N3U1_FLAN2|nr:CapA family protein [Flavilitoribacter nigricans]PHN03058.1 capsule biosynthesis protein CapA [Flavilitoribacter nigricans DSM 23189 = NBRC 102662]